VELAFLRIDGKGRVAGYSAVHFSSDGRQLCPELNEVLLALQFSDDTGLRFRVTAGRYHQQSVQLFSLLRSQSTSQQHEGLLQCPFACRGKQIAQGRTARAHDPLLLQPAPGLLAQGVRTRQRLSRFGQVL
jgi:hypothetical protein